MKDKELRHSLEYKPDKLYKWAGTCDLVTRLNGRIIRLCSRIKTLEDELGLVFINECTETLPKYKKKRRNKT